MQCSSGANWGPEGLDYCNGVGDYLKDLLLGGVKGQIAHIQGSGLFETLFELFLSTVKSAISVLADSRIELLHNKAACELHTENVVSDTANARQTH